MKGVGYAPGRWENDVENDVKITQRRKEALRNNFASVLLFYPRRL